jgi:hypothetical protein
VGVGGTCDTLPPEMEEKMEELARKIVEGSLSASRGRRAGGGVCGGGIHTLGGGKEKWRRSKSAATRERGGAGGSSTERERERERESEREHYALSTFAFRTHVERGAQVNVRLKKTHV